MFDDHTVLDDYMLALHNLYQITNTLRFERGRKYPQELDHAVAHVIEHINSHGLVVMPEYNITDPNIVRPHTGFFDPNNPREFTHIDYKPHNAYGPANILRHANGAIKTLEWNNHGKLYNGVNLVALDLYDDGGVDAIFWDGDMIPPTGVGINSVWYDLDKRTINFRYNCYGKLILSQDLDKWATKNNIVDYQNPTEFETTLMKLTFGH